MATAVRLNSLLGALAAVIGLTACDPASSNAQTWTPEDHDHNARSGQVSGSAAPGQEGVTLVQVTWRNQCAQCHGMRGRGDGPQGPMLKVPNLARPSMKDDLSDAEIAAVIKNGRNNMPAFSNLPPNVVNGLVQLIRSFGPR